VAGPLDRLVLMLCGPREFLPRPYGVGAPRKSCGRNYRSSHPMRRQRQRLNGRCPDSGEFMV